MKRKKLDSIIIVSSVVSLLFLTGCVVRKYGEVDTKSFTLQTKYNTFDSWSAIPRIHVESIYDNGNDKTNNAIFYNSSVNYRTFLTNYLNKRKISSDNQITLKIAIKKLNSECKNPFTAYTTAFLSVFTLGLIPHYRVNNDKYVIITLFPDNKLGELYFNIKTQECGSLGILGTLLFTNIWILPPREEFLGGYNFEFDTGFTSSIPLATFLLIVDKAFPIKE